VSGEAASRNQSRSRSTRGVNSSSAGAAALLLALNRSGQTAIIAPPGQQRRCLARFGGEPWRGGLGPYRAPTRALEAGGGCS